MKNLILLGVMFIVYGFFSMGILGAPEPEFTWIENDPNTLDSLFQCYQEEMGLPYLILITENWLTHNPVLEYNLHTGGRSGWLSQRGLDGQPTDIHPLEIGNLNGDNRIDLKDFAIYASRWGK